jgi:hypothetical protein
MKLKKEVTDKVLKTNRENAMHSTGPKTERGKKIVGGNAVKHGILSQKLRFKSEREERSHRRLIRDLQKTVEWNDPVARIYAEEFAAAAVRRGRFLSLEQALYMRQNPATELALETIKNSDVIDTGFVSFEPKAGWECRELRVVGRRANDNREKNGVVAVDDGKDEQFELAAKFSDPFDKLLRYDRATARDLYRAGGRVEKFRRHRRHDWDESS